MANYLYVIGSNDGPVKIGYTSNPHLRASTLGAASSSKISLLHCFAVESAVFEFETAVHLVLRAKRLNGEWFDVSSDEAHDAIVKTAAHAGVTITSALEALTIDRTKNPPQRGRPSSGKVIVTLRLDPEVVAKFKAGGPGWQQRMNDALKRERK